MRLSSGAQTAEQKYWCRSLGSWPSEPQWLWIAQLLTCRSKLVAGVLTESQLPLRTPIKLSARRSRLFPKTVIAMVVLLSLTNEAQASTPKIAVVWDSTDGCLDSDILRTEMHTKAPDLSVDLNGDTETSQFAILGKAELQSESWTVNLSVQDASHHAIAVRSFSVQGNDCESLLSHVSLIAVMLVESLILNSEVKREAPLGIESDDQETDGAQEEKNGSEPLGIETDDQKKDGALQNTKNPALLAPVQVEINDSVRPEDRRFSLALSSLIEFGRLPSDAFGFGLQLKWPTYRKWQLRVFAFSTLSTTTKEEVGESRLQLRGGGGSICTPGREYLGLSTALCAGIQASDLRAEGSRFVVNRVRHEVLLDAVLEAAIQKNLGRRFYIEALFSGKAALRRVGIVFADSTGQQIQLFTSPRVAFGVNIAAGIHFY